MAEAAGEDLRFDDWRRRVDLALFDALPGIDAEPRRLHAAMHHAALLGGKRMRPLLVYATGHACGMAIERLDPVAASVELIHAYSLVHDDLPAMDDDRLRRGQPTVHVAFDEATAILAGDALQSLAFSLLAGAPFDAGIRVAMLGELATAAGASGMCGGQALDVDATGRGNGGQSEVSPGDPHEVDDPGREIRSTPLFSLADLERLHAMKTGALLRASVRLGAVAAGVDDTTRTLLDRYADALGLAFQVRDDLLDVEGDSATLGKTAGKDAAQAKATFPALLGVDASRARLQALSTTMREALDAIAARGADVGALASLARIAVERDH